MLGVPLDGPAVMLGDNMSVVLNTTVPSSPLKKKHQACNYHRIREAIAANIVRFAHVESVNNYADLLTKPLPPATHQALVKPWLFRQPPFNPSMVVVADEALDKTAFADIEDIHEKNDSSKSNRRVRFEL